MTRSLSTQFKNGIKNKLCTLTIVEHLRTPKVSWEKKYQQLITNPQLLQYFPRESRDLFFKGTPAENFGQYSHQQRTKFPWTYERRPTKVTLFYLNEYPYFQRNTPLPWLQLLLDTRVLDCFQSSLESIFTDWFSKRSFWNMITIIASL